MIGRAREWNALLVAADGRWTFRLVMSLVTTDAEGAFNRFGRAYWPARDRAMGCWYQLQRRFS